MQFFVSYTFCDKIPDPPQKSKHFTKCHISLQSSRFAASLRIESEIKFFCKILSYAIFCELYLLRQNSGSTPKIETYYQVLYIIVIVSFRCIAENRN